MKRNRIQLPPARQSTLHSRPPLARMLRMLVNFLDPVIPVIAGSEVNDDPLAPISKYVRDMLEKYGLDCPIDWLPRDIAVERRPDGVIILKSRIPLQAYGTHIPASLAKWAVERPDRIWLAQRFHWLARLLC